MNVFKFFYLILILFLLSCNSEDSPTYTIDTHNGIFITNEGPFQSGTGTITFINPTTNEVNQEVYKKVNHEDLGNIVQSMYLYQDKAFIVVNNSHKIVVAERYSMKKITVIEGDYIHNPRYFTANNNFGYISNWGDLEDATDDFIAVINLNDYSLITKIPIGEGPERLLLDNNLLYVNLQGGFRFNDKTVIINTNTNQILSILQVGDVPKFIEKDTLGTIWVLCQGIPNYAVNYAETSGRLIKIQNEQIVADFSFLSDTQHPDNLAVDNQKLYFTINNKVFEMEVTAMELPSVSLNGLDGIYYSTKTKNSLFYGTDAKDYTSEGNLKIFNINSGELLHSYDTGIVPGNIIFN